MFVRMKDRELDFGKLQIKISAKSVLSVREYFPKASEVSVADKNNIT